MSPDRRRQEGSLLLELMLVAALSLALAVWAGQAWVQRSRDMQAQALAVWMQSARTAVAAYLDRHGALLGTLPPANALLAHGFADWSKPQWSELHEAGFLPSSWHPTGPLKQHLDIQVARDPDCVQAPCIVQALVATRAPLEKKPGIVDQALVAEWLQAMQGQGLVRALAAETVFQGAGMRWRAPPEVEGAWAPGTVAMVVGPALGPGGTVSAPTDHDPVPGGDAGDFLRVGDSRDPDFQGEAHVRGRIRSGADLVAADGLLLEGTWAVGQPCSTEGAWGRPRSGIGVMECRSGVWQTLLRPPGGGFLTNSVRQCKDSAGVSTANPLTGTCSCPPAYLMVRVSETGSPKSADGLTLGYICVPT